MRAAGHEKKAAAGREKLRAADPEEGVAASPGAGEDNFFARVYEAVRRIPCGRVATYGQIARLCGNARASRAVGYALHVNPAPGAIPCHRVVNREGRLAPAFAFGGPAVQRDLLTAEGVPSVARDGCFYVDLTRYGWFCGDMQSTMRDINA